jgi:CBS domain containing-hemolysin-like protein
MALLIFYLILAICLSFLCSILEAALLSVPRAHVAMLVEQGRAGGDRLAAMKQDIDRPLSAILTLNTIAHTVGAVGVGAQAAHVFGDAWVGLTSAVLTLLILVLSEIVPKTLGAVYAKPLAAFTAITTHGLIVLLWPIVRSLEWLSRLIGGRREQAKISRAELHSITRLGEDEGVLSEAESRVMRNLLALRDIEVRRIMTPRKVTFALQADQTVGEVIDPHNPIQFARVPAYGSDLDEMVGLVTRFEIHRAFREGRHDATMGQLARELRVIPEHASVADAIEQFLQHDSQLFQVVDEYGGTAGVVTLEDCIETLLGVEIVDETDHVADMRVLARQLLERQRSHMARRRDAKIQLWLDEPEKPDAPPPPPPGQAGRG